MELDTHSPGYSFAFSDEIVEQLSSSRKAGGGAVVKLRQCSHRISSRVEDELCPLRPARVRQRDGVHPRPRQKAREFLNSSHRSAGRLERPNPGITANVEANVPGADHVPGGKSSTANNEAHL